MISMNSPEVYETGSLNIRRECVCWLTGDAVAASTWRCSITANISVIPGCYIKRLAVSPWIGQEVYGGLCSAPVKGPHMLFLSSFSECMCAQHTCTDTPSKPIFWLKNKVDRLECPEQTASRRVSPACLHMLPEWAQIRNYCTACWNEKCSVPPFKWVLSIVGDVLGHAITGGGLISPKNRSAQSKMWPQTNSL